MSSRIASSAGRSGATSRVEFALVAGADVGEHFRVARGHPALLELPEAALGADFGRGRDEQLHVGTGRDHRPDVTTIEHGAAGLPGESRCRSSNAARTDG